MDETTLETYLDEVCAPLGHRVPAHEQERLRDELRDHLTTLAEAYEELGAERGKAELDAARHLGDPRKLGRAWLKSWRRGQARKLEAPPCVAFLTTLGLFGAVVAWGLAFAGFRFIANGPDKWFNWGDLIVFVGEIAAPVAGLASGFLTRSSRLTTFAAASAAAMLASLGIWQLLPQGMWGHAAHEIAVVGLYYWVPWGWPCAVAGKMLRNAADRVLGAQIA